MLDQIEPRQFNTWLVAWKMGVLDDTWDQTGTIAAAIKNEITRVFAGIGGKTKRKDYKYPAHYVPKSHLLVERTKEAIRKRRESNGSH